MKVFHHLREDDPADYVIENDPAFKTRIEEAFIEYATHGGIMADAMIKKLQGRLLHTGIVRHR